MNYRQKKKYLKKLQSQYEKEYLEIKDLNLDKNYIYIKAERANAVSKMLWVLHLRNYAHKHLAFESEITLGRAYDLTFRELKVLLKDGKSEDIIKEWANLK